LSFSLRAQSRYTKKLAIARIALAREEAAAGVAHRLR
jgi:hypothetical protein